MLRAVALMLAPVLLNAQQPAGTCVPPSSPDSLDVVIWARLTPFDTSQNLGAPFSGILLQEIGARLRVPDPFVLSTYVIADTLDGRNKKPVRAFAGAYAMFAITVHNGTIKPQLSVSSGVSALDRSFLEAVGSIGADSVVPPLPESLKGKKVELRLLIGTAQRPEGEQPLLRVRVPVVTLSHEPKLGPRRPGLQYPYELARANMDGSVLVHFVIGVDGEAVPGSLRIARATHFLFAQAVAEFIPKMRFEPARIAGCPVPVVVTQPFDFKIR